MAGGWAEVAGPGAGHVCGGDDRGDAAEFSLTRPFREDPPRRHLQCATLWLFRPGGAGVATALHVCFFCLTLQFYLYEQVKQQQQ